MNVNDVKKDLYKSKEIAKLSRYVAGNIYYKVKVDGNVYEFPIPTVVESDTVYDQPQYTLSDDLGTTTFYDEMKGSELNRWISKAINKDEFTLIESTLV